MRRRIAVCASASIESLEIDLVLSDRVVAPGEAYPRAVPGQIRADGFSACQYALRAAINLRGQFVGWAGKEIDLRVAIPGVEPGIAASSPRTATSGYFDSFPSSLVSRVTQTFALPPSGGRESRVTRARNSSLARVCQTASQTIQAMPSHRCPDSRSRSSDAPRRGGVAHRSVRRPRSSARPTPLRHRRRPRADPGGHDRSTIGGENRVAACAGQGVRPDVHACGGPEADPGRQRSVGGFVAPPHGNSPAGEGRDARFA